MSRFRLPRVVFILGAVSFMNDIASEMVMPLLPVFLVSALGAGPAVLGLIEGIADATSSLLKLLVGILADRKGRWGLFVRSGYAVSNFLRPLIGFAGSWLTVLGLRFGDRVGKGVRTAPRDALITASVSEERRGAAFGFHRAMDHAGASLGPVVAFLLLSLGWAVRDVILISFVPGILAVAIVFLGLGAARAVPSDASPRLSWSGLESEFKRLLLAAGGVAFATIPDSLLIFWAFGSGISVAQIPLLWASAHIGRMVSTGALGTLSDRFGQKRTTLFGWMLRVLIMLVLAAVTPAGLWVWILFIVYTTVSASTEAVERAWISVLAPEDLRASFFGAYHMITGLCVLPGAVLIGVVWETWNAHVAFLVSAGLTALFATALARAADRLPVRE